MQKIRSLDSAFRVMSISLDAIALVYVSMYFYWMFGVENTDTHLLTQLFVRFNPMTWGTYMLGAAALAHIFVFRNIVGRCLIITPYILSVVVSLIAIMGLTGWSDLLMYIPHIFVLIAAIMIIRKQTS